MSNKFINLENLKIYNEQMKEEYIKPLESELSGEVTIAIFNITTANTTIELIGLAGMTKTDWGDGTINNELSHTYVNVGEYKCKIYDVTSIGWHAFSDCDSLTSITIGDSVTMIGDEAFCNCYSLTNVMIGNSVTSIGYAAFWSCSSLTNITIPDSVTTIGYAAFSLCSNLTSIMIPDSVTTIGYEVFYDCYRLTIYCEATSQPNGWDSSWNSLNCPVVWGYKHKDYPEVVTKVGEIDNKLDKTGGDISGIVNVEGALTLPNSPDNPETAEVTDTYSTRQTANKGTTNLTVVDDSDTTVKKIYGATVATTNLIDPSKYLFTTLTSGGITITVQEDGGLQIKGTATVNNVSKDFVHMPFLRGLSGKIDYGSGVTDGDYRLSGAKDKVYLGINSTTGGIYYFIQGIGTTVDTVIYPMLSSGTTKKPYRPYFSGLKNAYFKGIRSTGKNWLDTEASRTIVAAAGGANKFVFSTGSVQKISLDAGASDHFYYKKVYPAGTYTISALVTSTSSVDASDDNYRVLIKSDTAISGATYSSFYKGYYANPASGESFSFTANSDFQIGFAFIGAQGSTQTYSNIMFGTAATEYEPYKEDESFILDKAIELGAYDYIDTERKKIVRQTKQYVFTGDEDCSLNYTGTDGKYRLAFFYGILEIPPSHYNGICNLYDTVTSIDTYLGVNGIAFNESTNHFYIFDNNYSGITAVKDFQTYLKQLYANGTPLTMAYQTKQPIDETDLDLPTDKYEVHDGGSETIIQGDIDNSLDGAIIGVEQEYKIHENPTEAATKAYVNNGLAQKLDKTGGTIKGNLIVEGKTETALGAIVSKQGDNVYGLAYEDEAYKLGQGTIDEEGDFSFNAGEGLPIALRDDSSTFDDGDLVAWSADGNKLSNSGISVDDINNKLDKVGGTVTGPILIPNSPDNPETAEVTDTYISRETANKSVTGLTVVDGAATTVTKIQGATVATTNLINPNGFERGAFDQTTGLPITGDNQFRTVYNIPCSAGEKIVQSNSKSYNMRAFFYGVSGNYISTALLSSNAPVTAPSGSSYVKIQTPSMSSTDFLVTDKYQLEYGTTATAYRPYFSGLRNAYFKGIRSTGKNLFDGEWISGAYRASDGTFGDKFVNYIATKNMISVVGEYKYSLLYIPLKTETIQQILFYDKNKNYISYTERPSNNQLITMPVNCAYININVYNANETMNVNSAGKMLVALSNVLVTEYEPYKGVDESFMLDEAVELANWDYVDAQEKKVVKQTNIITLDGNKTYNATSTGSLGGTSKYSYKYLFPSVIGGGSASRVVYQKNADIKKILLSGGNPTIGYSIIEIYSDTITTVDDLLTYFTNNPLELAYCTFKPIDENNLALPTDNYSSFDGGSETVIQGTVDNSADGAILSVTQTYSIHENPDEIAKKAYVNNGLAKKLDKTGGTITGSLIVEKGADTTLSALVVKNGDVAYGLTYDSEDESYKLGQGTVDEKGDFSFAEGEGAPVALREDSTAFVDGELLKWDATTNRLSSTGVTIEDIKNINKVVRLI